jgi:hypothetical protein
MFRRDFHFSPVQIDDLEEWQGMYNQLSLHIRNQVIFPRPYTIPLCRTTTFADFSFNFVKGGSATTISSGTLIDWKKADIGFTHSSS